MNRSLNSILPSEPKFCALAVKDCMDRGHIEAADALIDHLKNEVDMARARWIAAKKAKLSRKVN